MTMRWKPAVALSRQEKLIMKLHKRTRKLFAFLRLHRHEIVDEELERLLEEAYRSTGAGKDAKPPAMMVVALILQAYENVSDAMAVQLSALDKSWQMVLGNLGSDEPAFGQGTLFDFREKLIANELDKDILERTAKIARASGEFDARKLPKTLRVAVDSSPLEGAGRVEDTINLIAHAAAKVVDCAAELLEVEFGDVCRRAGIPLLLETSVKKALDRDWSDAEQKAEAVDRLARQVLSLERWLENHLADEMNRPPLETLLAVLDQLMTQDLEPDPDGTGFRIVDGVAEDRRISVEDGEMRHGRKTRSQRINGYKRHAARDLDRDAIVACAVTPANRPEHEALPSLKADVERQDLTIDEIHFDRAYMGSPTVEEIRREGGDVICKPWDGNNNGLFAKKHFEFDMRARAVMCPAGVAVPITFGKTAKFPAQACDDCCLREQCTTARRGVGRSITIAEDEREQHRLRKLAKTKKGRELFRQRVPIEHSLAHFGQRQGRRARYRGTRKNEFDMRRGGAIQNLETAHRKAS
ncbi:IS1182 family transposase [Myxococcota bacterium]